MVTHEGAEDGLFTPEIARRIGVTAATVRRWVKQRQLRATAHGPRYFVRADDLRTFCLQYGYPLPSRFLPPTQFVYVVEPSQSAKLRGAVTDALRDVRCTVSWFENAYRAMFTALAKAPAALAVSSRAYGNDLYFALSTFRTMPQGAMLRILLYDIPPGTRKDRLAAAATHWLRVEKRKQLAQAIAETAGLRLER
jgi:excisionase family DNA binding protein